MRIWQKWLLGEVSNSVIYNLFTFVDINFPLWRHYLGWQWDIINVKNFHEVLKYFFQILATPLHLAIQTYQQLCSIRSNYLKTWNKVIGPLFLEKCSVCNAVFGGCPFFLNMTLKKICSNYLRSCNPTNRNWYISLFSNSKVLVCRNPVLPHYLGHNLNKLTLI